MSLLKRIEKGASDTFFKTRLLARYGTMHPEQAKLPGCDHPIAIDPGDPCAVKKVLKASMRGRISDNLIFWREFNQHLKPGLCVDVGLSYGECLFGTRYSPKTRLYGFEANPRLIPHLKKSRELHPDGERMTVTHCLVGAESGDDQSFFIDLDWSEMSSAVTTADHSHRREETKVATRAIDDVIPPADSAGAKLLFKFDIEGFESTALLGFQRVLDDAASSVGLVEYDAAFTTGAGVDCEAYLDWLRQRFRVFYIGNLAKRLLLPLPDNGRDHHLTDPKKGYHGDLVLVGRGSESGWLPPSWSIEEGHPSS